MGKGKIINDFTKGPLFSTLIKFSLPYMLSNFLQVIYSVVDMIVVGHCVGHGGMAAVAVASRSYGFLVLLCVGLTGGAQVYLAQMIGKGDRSKLGRAVGTIFTMMAIIAVVSFVMMIFLAGPFLKLINTPGEVYPNALNYMLLRSIGIFFSFGYNMFSAVLRGVGDSKHPMIFVMISASLNLVLDLWFVGGLKMGVNGAAIATVIALAVKFVISAVFLYRRRAEIDFDFRPASWRIDRDIAHGILRVAIPFGIRFVAMDISMVFVQAQVNAVGVAAMAVFVSGIRLDNTVHTLATGVFSGASGIIGQNYGARKFDRIRTTIHYTWIICAGLYAIFVVLLLKFPKELFGIFTTDKAVQDLVPIFVSAIIWHFPAATITKGTTALIHGIGNAWLSFALAFIDAFFLRVTLSWVLGTKMGYGLYGYILGYALAAYGMAIPGLIYYFFCPWQKRKLVTD
jgi:putative MATE family efflux protein